VREVTGAYRDREFAECELDEIRLASGSIVRVTPLRERVQAAPSALASWCPGPPALSCRHPGLHEDDEMFEVHGRLEALCGQGCPARRVTPMSALIRNTVMPGEASNHGATATAKLPRERGFHHMIITASGETSFGRRTKRLPPAGCNLPSMPIRVAGDVQSLTEHPPEFLTRWKP